MRIATVYCNRTGDAWTVDISGTVREYDTLGAVQTALKELFDTVAEGLDGVGGEMHVSLHCESERTAQQVRKKVEKRLGRKEIVEITFPPGSTTRPGRPGTRGTINQLVVESQRQPPAPRASETPASGASPVEMSRKLSQLDTRITNVFRQLEQIRARLSTPGGTVEETDAGAATELRRVTADLSILRSRVDEVEGKRFATEAQLVRELDRLRHELRENPPASASPPRADGVAALEERVRELEIADVARGQRLEALEQQLQDLEDATLPENE